MWTTQFFILLAGAYADRSDGVYPKNLAVIVGEPVAFLCGTISNEEFIIWKVKKIGKLGEDLISSGFNVTKAYHSANFSIGHSKTGNNYVLRKNHVELDDAGTYKCILTGSRESVTGIGTAQLVVFGSKPECNASAVVMQEGDYLSIACSIFYNGSLNPTVECSGIDGSDFKVLANVNDPYGSNVLAMLTKKNISSSDSHRNISCITYFKSPTSIDNRTDAQKAYNAPEFTYHWIFQANVHYRPKSVNIDPRKEAYTNGEVIHCNADGNPIPSYAWKDIGSNAVASLNSTLVVNAITMHNRTYECTATNNRGSISASITVRVHESISKHGTNLIAVVTIFAGVLCAVLGVVVVALTIKRIAESCPWSKDSESPSGPDIVQNAEVLDQVREEQLFDGYAQAEDLGIVPVPRCAFGTVLGGNPIYDEINSEVKADAVVSEPEKTRLEFPVYGKANKSVKVADGISGATVPPKEFPAYGKVRKITNDKIQDFLEFCNPLLPMPNPEEAEEGSYNEPLEDTASQRRVIVGADGTEYMDMSAVRRLMQSEDQAAISAQSPEFTISQYAQIDHSHTS